MRGMLNCSATRWLDSRLRLTTPRSCTPWTLRKPGMWRLRTLPPAPIRPTRISSSAMRNLLHELLSQGQLYSDPGVLWVGVLDPTYETPILKAERVTGSDPERSVARVEPA